MSSRLRFPALGKAETGAGCHSDNLLVQRCQVGVKVSTRGDDSDPMSIGRIATERSAREEGTGLMVAAGSRPHGIRFLPLTVRKLCSEA